MQRLKLRRNHDQEFVQYDGSLFTLVWGDANPDIPSTGGHVYVRRFPQFLRDGRQLEVYRDYEGQYWLGTAIRQA